MAQSNAPDPSKQLVIVAGEQADGVTYQLHPVSRARVHANFLGASTARSLFVGTDTQADYTDIHGPMWEQIVVLLTGLSVDRLVKLGEIVVFFPTTGHLLRPMFRADNEAALAG